LTSEQIVRLKNGFPTTEREAKEFDEKQKANELAREEYVRNLVKVRTPHRNTRTRRTHARIGHHGCSVRAGLLTRPVSLVWACVCISVCGAQAEDQGRPEEAQGGQERAVPGLLERQEVQGLLLEQV
jgi:hypothetical protein